MKLIPLPQTRVNLSHDHMGQVNPLQQEKHYTVKKRGVFKQNQPEAGHSKIHIFRY